MSGWRRKKRSGEREKMRPGECKKGRMGAGKKSIKEDPLPPGKARVGFIEFKTKDKSKKYSKL
jgi:hypothetical protein